MYIYRAAFALVAACSLSEAFVVPTSRTSLSAVQTSLNALPPPLIIGPMIKKMQEERDKQKMPMADAGEAADQAPGLRVGKGAWKWPVVWPYDESFFKTTADINAAQQSQLDINSMASMLSGVSQVPTPAKDLNGEEQQDTNKFDPLKYWGEEQASVTTDMDPEAAEQLTAHYSFYLKDGMSVLELGAAEKSYLPQDFKPSRHVGAGASKALMEQNPSITESIVVDLNKAVPDRDVDSDDLRRLAQEPFDAVIMANTVDFLTSPREVFRSAWYLLKPGGTMIVSFSGKEGTKNKFVDAQTKMWRDYNDDQHLWMTGSFFQFSAGEGWESLLGFDVSPESAKKESTGPLSVLDRGKNNNIYVVQAVKAYQDESIDPANLKRSIKSLCWMLPTMEKRDKDLVVERLVRAYETSEQDTVKEAIERNIQQLPKIYEALVKMDQFAFGFGMQAQMAADLISDPNFTAADEQILALKQGLGLRTPSPEFWAPIGENTSAMQVDEKISLLAFIVPRFGSGDEAQEQALKDFLSGLKPTYAVIRSKCPDLAESDVQLLGTELLAAEILTPGRTSKKEFAAWLAAFSGEELLDLLSERKSIREKAKEDLAAFKKARVEEEAEMEEYKRLYEEQMETARLQRSLIFNPRTQKMEVYDNPYKK